MLKLITVHYSGTLLLPDGTRDPFGPYACIARRHQQGYQVHIGGDRPTTRDTLYEAVKDAAELAWCAPVANLRVVEA